MSPSTCKYCQKEIYWQKVNAVWTPYEDDSCSIRHLCRKRVLDHYSWAEITKRYIDAYSNGCQFQD